MDLVKLAARVASPGTDGVPEAVGAKRKPRAKRPMEAVFMSIQHPEGMDKAEAVERAKRLIPCETGEWEEEQAEADWTVGNMDCEAGFYDENPDGGEYGPDDAGVSVSWETP
jgi:hypothetical protein